MLEILFLKNQLFHKIKNKIEYSSEITTSFERISIVISEEGKIKFQIECKKLYVTLKY